MLSSGPTSETKNEFHYSDSASLSQQHAVAKRDSARLSEIYYQLIDLDHRDFRAQLSQLKTNLFNMINDENQTAFIRLERCKQTLQLAIAVYGCCRRSGRDSELTTAAIALETAIAAASRGLEHIEEMELLSRLAEKSIVLLLAGDLPQEEYACFDAITNKLASHQHQKMQAAAQAAYEFKSTIARLFVAAVVLAACFIAPSICGSLALVATIASLFTVDYMLHLPIDHAYHKKSEAKVKAGRWSEVSNAAATFFTRRSQRFDACHPERSEGSLSLSRA